MVEPATAIPAPISAALLLPEVVAADAAAAALAAPAAAADPAAAPASRGVHGGHEHYDGGDDEHSTDPGHDVEPRPAQPGQHRHSADQRQSGYPRGCHITSSATASRIRAVVSSTAVGTCHGRNSRPRSTKTRENSS
jgi:hypothetical protein